MGFQVIRLRRARDGADRDQVLEISRHDRLDEAMRVFHDWRFAHAEAVAIGAQQVMVVSRR
ncbi:hypothetical protein R8Z50_27900 [Longispora sp. K20-0274]|uniref:hypothetical protein n=1 Tax=Longispora sp. K20-0274 TaxID=3088255 RepID=UPI00399AA43C